MAELFADVLLPLPLYEKYTYRIPREIADGVLAGKRVAVPFGNKKLYAGLVISVHNKKPDFQNIKDIIAVIDENPVVYPKQLKLWEWMAGYYCCLEGDVMNAALPAGLKMESHEKFRIVKTGGQIAEKEEELFLEKLRDKNYSISELQKMTGDSFSFSILKKLLANGNLQVCEKMEAGYKPKVTEVVTLHPSVKNQDDLNRTLAMLKRSRKQTALLQHFIHIAGPFNKSRVTGIAKHELLAETDYSYADLNGLIGKNILATHTQNVSRIPDDFTGQTTLNILSQEQQEACEMIKEQFNTKPVVLLHGVTASGKTEIYIHLLREMMNEGRQALYLVPEISLTTQIIRRLKDAFGNKVGIYHSKLNDQERVEIWNKVLSFRSEPAHSYQVILGARSSVFLPFSDLGLIVVDEEHESSYKQFDPAPRYHARDIAIVMASFNNAKVLLGSATPSLESYLNVKAGKYGLTEITKRYSDVRLPVIRVTDLQKAYKKRQMKAMFTAELYDLIGGALNRSEQVILFQNRRGYSPFIECLDCGWIPKCRSCDVSLTFHKENLSLTCHYCGHSESYPNECPKCHSREVKTRGFGTEKIETEIRSLFVNARVARMDFDTTRSKQAFEKIINNLESRKTDILVGTQMVTKGLDFENVSLVGILNADNLINFPDFRAHERAYQLMSQVSGRAGRRNREGIVVIQSSQPDHPVNQAVKNQAFQEFMNTQLAERKLFNYPPYSRLIKIIIKHKNQDKAASVARELAEILRNEDKITVLGPESPLISRVQLWHLKEIWIKIPKDKSLPGKKKFIRDSAEKIRHLPGNSGAMINIDVDPM